MSSTNGDNWSRSLCVKKHYFQPIFSERICNVISAGFSEESVVYSCFVGSFSLLHRLPGVGQNDIETEKRLQLYGCCTCNDIGMLVNVDTNIAAMNPSITSHQICQIIKIHRLPSTSNLPCAHGCGSHNDVIKWKHFPGYWPFVRGIHRPPVNSLHTGQ